MEIKVCMNTNSCIVPWSYLLSYHLFCAENVIYDEPSLPDPIYQEVIGNYKSASLEQEIQMEMMKNCSYVTVRSKKCSIILNECPAYIQHS